MISLTKKIGLGLAATCSLPLAIATFPAPALSESVPQPTQPEGAAALGSSLTPSNSTLFQGPTTQATDKTTPKSLKVDSTNHINKNAQRPLAWESEHLNNQRRSSGGFSLVNVDTD